MPSLQGTRPLCPRPGRSSMPPKCLASAASPPDGARSSPPTWRWAGLWREGTLPSLAPSGAFPLASAVSAPGGALGKAECLPSKGPVHCALGPVVLRCHRSVWQTPQALPTAPEAARPLGMGGPLEGRHSAFPSAVRRFSSGKRCERASRRAREGRMPSLQGTRPLCPRPGRSSMPPKLLASAASPPDGTRSSPPTWRWGPLEGRHSAFPSAVRRFPLASAVSAPGGALGKAECLPSKGLLNALASSCRCRSLPAGRTAPTLLTRRQTTSRRTWRLHS